MAFIVPFIPAIIGAGTALYGARQQRQGREYQAEINEQNAKVTRLQSNAEEEARRRQMALDLGRQRAEATETGFNPGGGSFLNLLTKNAGEMELDVLTARYRGQLESMGLEQDAKVQRSNAKKATASGNLSAFGTLYGAQTNYLQSSMIRGS